MRLLLFDVYVRTSLLYGGPVWGMAYLPALGDLVRDCMGRMGVFYCRCLRSLLGLARNTRNKVLYVLSGRGLLQLYLAKVVFRFVIHAELHPGLLGMVAAWVCGLESRCLRDGLYFAVAQSFAYHYRSVPDLYATTVEAL